jgi:hypothetical protein
VCAAGGTKQDAILGEKPTSRGKTPFKPKASNSLSFALSKKLQQAFTPLAVELDKVKCIKTSQLTEFFDNAAIKYHPSEIDIVMQQLKLDYDRNMRDDAHRLSFDDVLEMLNRLCIRMQECMHVCACVFLDASMRVCVCVCCCVCKYIYTCMHARVCTYACIHTYLQVYIITYV